LDEDNPQKAWQLVKIWYCHHARAVLPTPADLCTIEQDFWALYTWQTPPGDPMCRLATFNILDGIPDEIEIGMMLKTLQLGCAQILDYLPPM